MTAMHKATDNATGLKSIEIDLHKARQASITKILEIVGGAEALNG
jgi:F0F1-type ATP synthase gamma subunit